VTGGSARKHGEVERSHRRIEGGDGGDVLATKQYQGDGRIGVDRHWQPEPLRSAPVLAGYMDRLDRCEQGIAPDVAVRVGGRQVVDARA
jgi:hypothetical protein